MEEFEVVPEILNKITSSYNNIYFSKTSTNQEILNKMIKFELNKKKRCFAIKNESMSNEIMRNMPNDFFEKQQNLTEQISTVINDFVKGYISETEYLENYNKVIKEIAKTFNDEILYNSLIMATDYDNKLMKKLGLTYTEIYNATPHVPMKKNYTKCILNKGPKISGISLEEISENDCYECPNGHPFTKEEIEEWIRIKGKHDALCPICRVPLFIQGGQSFGKRRRRKRSKRRSKRRRSKN